jgi:hypothetical protein
MGQPEAARKRMRLNSKNLPLAFSKSTRGVVHAFQQGPLMRYRILNGI